MLQQAFVETTDYHMLIEGDGRHVVVGRRGTGKSALALKLAERSGKDEGTILITIGADEEDHIGIRERLERFKGGYGSQKAAAKLVWLYGIYQEIQRRVNDRGKQNRQGRGERKQRGVDWERAGRNVEERIWEALKQFGEQGEEGAEVGELSKRLGIRGTQETLARVLQEDGRMVQLIVDRLDEGWDVSDTAVAAINGLVQAVIECQTRLKHVRPVVFIRDNMLRALERKDQDFSRNIGPHVLRLHWTDQKLWEFITARLRIARGRKQEATEKVWNNDVESDLQSIDGFKTCLKRTLYRPRDVWDLCQRSFDLAELERRERIGIRDIQRAAREISRNRVLDMVKEYEELLPLLEIYLEVWKDGAAIRKAEEIVAEVKNRVENVESGSRAKQEWSILSGKATSVLKQQYEVGLVGIQDERSNVFVFCQDGQAQIREMRAEDTIMVHPAYWAELNANSTELDQAEAEQIHDEYDIQRHSETPALRQRQLRETREELNKVPKGQEGADEFEQWCANVIKICFAKSLENVERKPRSVGAKQPDIIARNQALSPFWKRVREDYGGRQIVFEAKNYEGYSGRTIQQIDSYLTHGYGRLAILITRGGGDELHRGGEVEQARTLWADEKKVVLRVSTNRLLKLLQWLEQVQRHDKVDNFLEKLLDTYERTYIHGQQPRGIQRRHRKRKR